MTSSTKNWLHGLAAAVIGGGASAVTGGVGASLVDPSHFNFGVELIPTLKLMGALFAVNAVLSAFAYLKQSPIPPEKAGS